MEDIIALVKPHTKTLEDFRKWLFMKLNKNTQSFHNFVKYPNRLKIPFFIEYLESKNVPIIEAIIYYNVVSNMQASSYEELLAFTILSEFKRIEENKTTDYIPF